LDQFFKLPKSIIRHEILHTKNAVSLRLFLLILGNACYREGVQVKDTKIILNRGQWLRSNRKLQTDLGASSKSLIKSIRWLEEKNLMTTESTQLGTIFTIKKFDIYQGQVLSIGKHQEAECFPQENGGCFPQENNTKNYKQTKNYKESNIYSLNSVKGEKHNERDTSTIEWDQFPHLKF
jgi:hypothetical protein